MNTHTPTRRVAAKRLIGVAAIAATLVTAGCGSSGDKGGDVPMRTGEFIENQPGNAQNTFDFSGPGFSAKDKLTIKLPEGLKTAMGADASAILVDSFELEAKQLGGAEFCAFTAKPTYVNDGLKVLGSAPMSDGSNKEPFERVGQAVLGGVPKALSQLNESSPERYEYSNADGTLFTMVQRCATTPSDDGSDDELRIPVVSDRYSTGWAGLASANVTVMKDGLLTVREHEVSGYTLDSSGNWIKK